MSDVCRFCEVKLEAMSSAVVGHSQLGGPSLSDLFDKNTVRLHLQYCPKCGLVYHR
jgi:hypothetical protein